MLVLGVILVILSVAALVTALVGGSDESVSFDLALVQGQISATGVFLLGALTLLLFVIGLELIRSGTRRARRRRKEHKELDHLSERLQSHEATQRGATTTATEEPESTTSRDPE